MFDRTDDRRDRDRGQVGIGTLIVFIAMVLVAAIAAGVLINTAGFLQSSAEESGEQASEQVTNRLVEVNTVGHVNNANDSGAGAEDLIENGTIDYVNMTTRLAPGSSDVNLNDTTMQWVSPDESSQLVARDTSTSGDYPIFNWTTVRDNDASVQNDDTLNDPVDRAEITINLNQTQLSTLDAGQSAELQISTRSGGQTTITLVVPDSLSNKNTVQL
ncbi:archaellin/type IV pilin N-terminal domain-containing protein [Halapricum desulfuricans]|uniref:Flagellin n=1 Tax=Halapricum desulfuricans TaxID=2841257 RepID=A0A897NS68_9EURY|nr:archaellin/type IV pilin N-terminal domain-containing protein [Halapricum desulfuricans]QSG15692.1 Archaeal flagellin [Halapricum desulfuricans]